MDLFKDLPSDKRDYMELLFRNCTEEVKYYMSLLEIPAGQTFIKAGVDCTHIFLILSGKVTGIEWPTYEQAYPFKDFGPGDFFQEIECFAGLPQYRISIVAATKCKVLTIPADSYMEWMRMDGDALFLRAQENIHRLITQTAEARKYLFMEGKDRLMVHLIRLYEQQPSPLWSSGRPGHRWRKRSASPSRPSTAASSAWRSFRSSKSIKARSSSRRRYQQNRRYIEHYING